MAKKRGNPDWGKPEVNTVPYAGVSSFEAVVRKLRLSPTDYEGSIQLQEWARKNKDQKYVPSNQPDPKAIVQPGEAPSLLYRLSVPWESGCGGRQQFMSRSTFASSAALLASEVQPSLESTN